MNDSNTLLTPQEMDQSMIQVNDENALSDLDSTLKKEEALSPKQIVEQLDKYIIGQSAAVRAIAVALRDRQRRMKLPNWLREEITPKNVLMIGSSGVGKTEIALRASKIGNAPFLKVEATKFTEVGYIGRDVDSIIRDLADAAFKKLREVEIARLGEKVKEAVEERILDFFIKPSRSKQSNAEDQSERQVARNSYRRRLQEGLLDDKEIEVELNPSIGVEIVGPPGMEEMTSQLQGMMQNLGGGRIRKYRMKIKDALKALQQEEANKLLNEDDLKRHAIEWIEEKGIVFIDEIDKICRRGEMGGADVSREGVQRDLLPLIEGSTISTKYGMVRTNHILFITAGAFQSGQKPSDLIPELQGRLPIRVELSPLTVEDFIRILKERHASLLVQYQALLKTEGLTIDFSDTAVVRIAEIAYSLNEKIENVGARRLYTVMEKLLETLSFEADTLKGQSITIDVEYVNQRLANLAEDEDSSHYIL